jgi:hypothetical protein
MLAEVLDGLAVDFRDLVAVADRRIASSAAKAHRYVAEMHEIATTQASAGLPAAVFDAIAEAYAAISRSPAGQATPEEAARVERLDDILAAIGPGSPEVPAG